MRLPSSASRAISLLVLLVLPGSAARGEVDWEDVLRITDNIVCTCSCPPTQVSACSCGRSGEMNEEVQNMLEEGKSDDQIYDFYTTQFGHSVLAAPRAEGFNLLGWVLPFVALALGGGVVVAAYRRLREDQAPPSGQSRKRKMIDPEIKERIKRELADLD